VCVDLLLITFIMSHVLSVVKWRSGVATWFVWCNAFQLASAFVLSAVSHCISIVHGLSAQRYQFILMWRRVTI